MLKQFFLFIYYTLEGFLCCNNRTYNKIDNNYYKYGKTYRQQSLKKIIK